MLFRAHYEVVRTLGLTPNRFFRDVLDYPALNELMLVADMLVSDYSSIFFDYSVPARPMFCFAYDYETYARECGLYFDIRKALPCEARRSAAGTRIVPVPAGATCVPAKPRILRNEFSTP